MAHIKQLVFVSVNEPLHDGKEREYLIERIETGWISAKGPFVREFENGFPQRMGRKFGFAFYTRSAALELAVAPMEIAPEDEVILPTNSDLQATINKAEFHLETGARFFLDDCYGPAVLMDLPAAPAIRMEAKFSQITRTMTGRTSGIDTWNICFLRRS